MEQLLTIAKKSPPGQNRAGLRRYLRRSAVVGCLGAEVKKRLMAAQRLLRARIPSSQNLRVRAKKDSGQYFARHQAAVGVGCYFVDAGINSVHCWPLAKPTVASRGGMLALYLGQLFGRGYGVEYPHALAA